MSTPAPHGRTGPRGPHQRNDRVNGVPHAPDGMTYEEIAVELGVSRGTVMNIERSALRKLRILCRVERPETMRELRLKHTWDGPESV